MLIFWKLIFAEDLHLYQKSYGDGANISNRTHYGTSYKVYYPGIYYEIAYTDKVINYCMGTLFCLFFLTSMLLNPLVIIYYSNCCKTPGRVYFPTDCSVRSDNKFCCTPFLCLSDVPSKAISVFHPNIKSRPTLLPASSAASRSFARLFWPLLEP